MSFWAQAWEVARTDIRIESRAGEVFKVVTPFAVVALLVFPIALGFQLSVVREIGVGVFWALSILFGMQIALRQSAADSLERRDVQALLGVDPAARFTGRVMSATLLTLGFMGVLLVAMTLLYTPSLPDGWAVGLIVTSVLMAVGLAELGTLAGELTAGLRNRANLASLIVAPLAIPLVMGASQTVEALARDESILPWVLLLMASVLALAVGGVALARPLEEAAQ